jgi:hypothetical protein
MKEAIAIIENIIDYNSNTKWGSALRYAVKLLLEKSNKSKPHNKTSLPSKINNLKVNEIMVLFPDDYRTFMRSLGAHKCRGNIPLIEYKKVQVIYDNTLLIGVSIKRLE